MLRLVGIRGRKNMPPKVPTLECFFQEPREMQRSLDYFV